MDELHLLIQKVSRELLLCHKMRRAQESYQTPTSVTAFLASCKKLFVGRKLAL